MSTPTAVPEVGTPDIGGEDEYPAEGVTSDQVMHAQDESRAEGEPYEDESAK